MAYIIIRLTITDLSSRHVINVVQEKHDLALVSFREARNLMVEQNTAVPLYTIFSLLLIINKKWI